MFKKVLGFLAMAVGIVLVCAVGLFFWRRAKPSTVAGTGMTAVEAQVVTPPTATPVQQQLPPQVKTDPVAAVGNAITQLGNNLPGMMQNVAGIADDIGGVFKGFMH